MQPENQILDNQQVYIQFTIENSHYAVPIEFVKEIIEWQKIIPYPQKRKDHLGVFSLRGLIVPVIEYAKHNSFYNNQLKFLILEFQEGSAFAVIVNKAKRIVVDEAQLNLSIFNIENQPIQVLHEADFIRFTNKKEVA